MIELFWHFAAPNADGKPALGYGDGRLIEVGLTHTVNVEPILCEQGLHASRRAIDALRYAPSAIITRCTLGGKIVHGEDKSVATARTYIWMMDVTNLLHELACQFAEMALARVGNPDPRSIAVLDAKRRWLRGGITDQQLAAACAAAWDAACAAAWDAAREAAKDAAKDAANAAAWAAWEAARATAWNASGGAGAAREAASAAASAAAWNARGGIWADRAARATAKAAQNEILENALFAAGAPR